MDRTYWKECREEREGTEIRCLCLLLHYPETSTSFYRTLCTIRHRTLCGLRALVLGHFCPDS